MLSYLLKELLRTLQDHKEGKKIYGLAKIIIQAFSSKGKECILAKVIQENLKLILKEDQFKSNIKNRS